MGSANTFQSGRFSAWKALKRAFRLAALTALVLGFAPSRASAQTLNTCGTIGTAGSYILTSNFAVSANPCFIIGTNNVSLNLNAQTLDMTAFSDAGVAINAGNYTGTSIIGNGATILTAYISGAAGAAIEASGGSGLTITGVNIFNQTTATTSTGYTAAYLCANPSLGGASVAQLQEYGSGISLTSVTGATISANNVCFYQDGISVQDSAIASTSSGSRASSTAIRCISRSIAK